MDPRAARRRGAHAHLHVRPGGLCLERPGPEPRTFAQLAYELRAALARAGERAPYVLVGHSYGGGVVRAHAPAHPGDVAGLVFVDIVSEHQFISMGPRAGRIGDGAQGRPIPPARDLGPADARNGSPASSSPPTPPTVLPGPPYDRLPARERELHAWAASLPALGPTEDSQRDWSAEYFARWAATPQAGSLGRMPLIVLTRARGGFRDSLDRPAAELERIRLEAQRGLATLSTAGEQRIVESGHSMHLEAPEVVARAIGDIVEAVRRR